MFRLSLFGGFTLLGADGATVVIAARKCRALLAYLALQARPTPRERLAGLLWGDGGEARARGSLRQALTTLRQEIPGDGAWLVASADEVAVDRAALWVDVVAADQMLQAGNAAGALELSARGAPLGGLNPGAAEFDEWADGERRRWRERETAALAALGEQARQAGDQRQVLALGRRLLKLEPWNEEAHRLVMAALAALGRRSEALRQYQLAVEALRAELGVAPDPRTERLLVQIRSERAAAPAAEPAAPAAPEPAAVEPSAAADLVGRELERLQMQGLLKGCQLSGRGHVVLLRGEAGMGKTTFLRELMTGARALGFSDHLVQASDSGTGRNLEVLRGALAAFGAEAQVPPEHRLAVHELLGRELDADEAALAAAMDPEARAQAHVRAAEAVVAASGGPARLLAVEDLHWCDPETTRILCAIAGAGQRHRVVTVFTCRTGEEPVDRAWPALLGRGSFTSIDLGPLAPEDAARLAARYGRDADQTRRCLERAAGHPLFLLQLLESGTAGDSVPESVQAAVLARLARVPPAERAVLEGAAVMGSSFSPAEVVRLVERHHPDPGTPAAALIDRLVQRGWLRVDGARLTIAHDLLGAAIRSGLQGPRLGELHHWAAECFANLDPLRSAEHLDQAADPGAALAYLSVARDALAERRLDLAESVLDRIDGVRADPDLAFAALCLRGDVRRERADPAGSHEVFARAAAQAQTDAQRAQARLGLAAALRLLDRHPEALARLDEADAVTDAADHLTRAALEHLRGNLLFTSGKLPGCRAAHERALAHARAAESAADEVAALSGLGDAFYLEGRLASSRRAFQACYDLAHSHGILRMEAAAGMMLSLTVFYGNEMARSLAFGREALALAERIGDARLDCLTASIMTIVLAATGDRPAARAMAERTQVSARRLGSERLQAMGIELYAHTLIPEGRQREALPMVRQALALSRRSDGLAISGPSILAALAAAETDLAASREAIREGEEMLAGSCPIHAHFDLRERAMALALRRSEWAEVRHHADALEAHLGAEPPARMLVVNEQARLLARLGERPDDREAKARLERVRDEVRAAGLTLLASWPSGLTAS